MKNILRTKSNWFIIPLALFIIFRIFLIGLEYKVTGGSEFAMDKWNFTMGLKPFSVLTFENDKSGYSQPPLYPLAIAPLAIPLNATVDSFLAPRITYTILELFAFIVMILFLAKSQLMKKIDKFFVLMVLSFSPLGFMTGSVMKQEEPIVMLFTAAVLLAWRLGSIRIASILTFLGIITAKILFGVVFLALLMLANNKKQVIIWGLLPSVLFLVIYSIIGFLITGTIPFIDFSPGTIKFCSTLYVLLLKYTSISAPAMKWPSLLLTAAATVIIWFYKKNSSYDNFPLLMIISFCVLYLFFYHVNTEYHIFFLPLLAYIPFSFAGRRNKIIIMLLHFILSVATWGYGIAFGLRNYAEGIGYRSASKELLLSLYDRSLGFIPLGILETSLLILTIFSIMLLMIISIQMLKRKRQDVISFHPDA